MLTKWHTACIRLLLLQKTVQQLINIPVFTAATFAVVAHAG